jgi:histidinol phosphatase-like PHP family hydrolase
VEIALTKSELFSGRYFFHAHTPLTDGKLTLDEYFDFAAACRIDRLIFLEHIRRNPTYDVTRFASEIEAASRRFGIEAVVGFETKLLPDATLNISPENFAIAQIVGIAEHGFPNDLPLLEDALIRAFARYHSLDPAKPLVWVHPGLTFRRAGFDPLAHPGYKLLLTWAEEMGLLLEKNLRYGLLPDEAISDFNLSQVVVGADAHTADELKAWAAAFAVPCTPRASATVTG